MANLQGTFFQHSKFSSGQPATLQARVVINDSKQQRKDWTEGFVRRLDPQIMEEIYKSLNALMVDAHLPKTDRLNAAKKLFELRIYSDFYLDKYLGLLK